MGGRHDVRHFSQLGKHEKMGMNVVPLKDLTPDEAKTLTLDLLKNMDPNDPQNEKARGQIVLEATYKPFKEEELENASEEQGVDLVEKAPEGTPATGGLLVVIVHEAQDLEGKHHTNPFVRILFRGEEKKTKVTAGPPVDFCPPTPPRLFFPHLVGFHG